MVAALVLFDPKLAIGALFVPGSLDEHHELSIGCVHLGQFPIFLAGEIGVHLALAPQAVVLRARGTLVVVEGGVEGEDCLAPRGRTPTGVCVVQLDVLVEGELIVLLSQLPRKVFAGFFGKQLNRALFIGTS